LVRLIQVLHFPVLRLGPFNSSPAFSSPQIWLVHLIPVLHFQSPQLAYAQQSWYDRLVLPMYVAVLPVSDANENNR